MTTKPTDGLKPCPFCGEDGTDKPFTYEDWPDWYVQCGQCDARTGHFFTETQAAEAWNSRASQEQPQP